MEQWREANKSHPGYSEDHEEERKFRETKRKIDAEINNLIREIESLEEEIRKFPDN